MEFILMIFLCAILWVFVVCPALIEFAFNPTGTTYLEAVGCGLAFTLVILGVFIFALLFGVCINFIGGDPEPITTLINRIKS